MVLNERNLNYIPLIQYFHSPSNNLSISNSQPIMTFQKKIFFSATKKSAYKFVDLSTIDRESDLNQSINSASDKYKKQLCKSQTDSSFESRHCFVRKKKQFNSIPKCDSDWFCHPQKKKSIRKNKTDTSIQPSLLPFEFNSPILFFSSSFSSFLPALS